MQYYNMKICNFSKDVLVSKRNDILVLGATIAVYDIQAHDVVTMGYAACA